MGLLNMLTSAGTPLSINNGVTPTINPGATKQSKLHADGNAPSYSMNGANAQTVNAAYVVLGLLYGNGDFTKTIEITTRCGQDADCNPSSAGGILGTLIGYDAIPNYWLAGLKEAENIDFKYTSTSLNKVYEIGTKHALDNILRNGGKISADQVTIRTQTPKSVHFEESFTNLQPQEKKWIGKTLKDEIEYLKKMVDKFLEK